MATSSKWRGVCTAVRVTKRNIKTITTVKTTAGFTGGSKLSRAVTSEMHDALEEATNERKGTERMTGKPVIAVADDDDGTKQLSVVYRAPKKKKDTSEIYEYVSKDELIESITGTEECTQLHLASFDPHIYFLIHHHFEGDVETGMQELGILQKKRTRKKVKK